MQEQPGNRKVQVEHLVDFIVKQINVEELPHCVTLIKKEVTRFCSELFHRLDGVHRKTARFLTNNKNRLSENFVCNVTDSSTVRNNENSTTTPKKYHHLIPIISIYFYYCLSISSCLPIYLHIFCYGASILNTTSNQLTIKNEAH